MTFRITIKKILRFVAKFKDNKNYKHDFHNFALDESVPYCVANIKSAHSTCKVPEKKLTD